MVKTSASTNPRGNLWLKDKNRVGLKLMQKMGWSEGRGLGSKEDGLKEPIKVRPKNDAKGVGFQDDNDNNWLEHQDEFNALLSRLNENNVETSTKMISLEEKSKSSRSRVHYHKYTRGKDLSSCSEKDLACILGKRKKDDAFESESNNVTVSKMSSQDYFLQKKGLLEKKHEECDPAQILSTAAEKPRKRKNDSAVDETCRDSEDLSEAGKEECNSLQSADCISKKKKHKRRKEASAQETEENEANKEECDFLEMPQSCVNKKKHKRKKETSICNSEEEEPNEVVEQIGETPVKKRKHEKLVKNKPDLGTCEDTSQNLEQSFKDDKTESLEVLETISKKHKKEKKKLLVPDIVDDELEVKSYIQTRKRKSRSCNDDAHLREDCFPIDLDGIEKEEKSSKKKLKKTKSQADGNDETTLIEDQINNEHLELSTTELEITKKEKPKLKRTDDKKALDDTAEDASNQDSAINKKEFVIALLATFRQPSGNLPDLFNDIMKGELFNGSNFFSIKGYGDEWL